MAGFPEYANYDALGLADLVRKKQVSPQELVEEAINRIETHNPQINAIINKLYDSARETAKNPLPEGPFSGVPFLIKDLMATIAGVPTSNGNRLSKNIPAKTDSEMVKRWKKAGVVILGKTNTPEFGLVPFTEPGAFGPTNNPWDLTRSPGGSSGGSGAAVAARIVPMASGGDGGGSIRIPSSACGVFGLKPTRGRTPTGPELGEAWDGLSIEHVITRSVRDSAAMLDATQGADVGAPYYAPPMNGSFLSEVTRAPGKLRVAFTGAPLLGKQVHADVLAALQETVSLLKELGHEVIEATPKVDNEAFSLAFFTVLAGQMRADIEEAARVAGKKVSVNDFDMTTFGTGLVGKGLNAQEYVSAWRYLQASARQIARFFLDYDLLLTPTLSQPPIKTGALQLAASEETMIKLIGSLDAAQVLKVLGIIKPLAAKNFEYLPWTPVFNVTGQPAMSVPLYWNAEGLPIGMHFVAKFGDEAGLFRLAGQLEQARPWAGKVPPGF